MYKRQDLIHTYHDDGQNVPEPVAVLQLAQRNGQSVVRYQPGGANHAWIPVPADRFFLLEMVWDSEEETITLAAVSYTHLRAHETVLDLVCRLLLEKNTMKYPHNAVF